MTLYCKDFVGYVALPDNTSTANLLLKARYQRLDPEIETIEILLYIEGELVFNKQYQAQDTLDIQESFPVEWRWGAASCPAFYAERLGVYQPRYYVMVSVGEGASVTANTFNETCMSVTPTGGRVEATIVTSDEIVWFSGAPGTVLYMCGGVLEEGAVRATLVLRECSSGGRCVESSYGLLLYAVAPSSVQQEAYLTTIASYSVR